ncbi:MAG TPA: DMT family transporter [Dongiaceae bacterium]|nr:DMT family transporter [Dongiaceae bacterium]
MTSISTTAASSRHPGLAALSLCAGVMIFSGQDWIIKLLSGDYPVHQAIAIRGVVAVLILLAYIALDGKIESLRSKRMGLLIVRGLVLMMAYTTYYLAFPSMPLANIVALWFTVPLFVTALAGPFLGEKVGVRRWAAAIVGFAGVLIIVRPLADSFSLASLLPIASALTYSISALMARRMGETESAPVMSFYQNLVYLLVALVMAAIFGSGGFEGTSDPSLEFLVRGWVTPSWIDLALLAACGVIASIATVLLTQAYRMAEANFVACFEYSAIIWATLGGYLFWREVPDVYFVVGAALIVVAGLYVLFRTQPATPLETEKV